MFFKKSSLILFFSFLSTVLISCGPNASSSAEEETEKVTELLEADRGEGFKDLSSYRDSLKSVLGLNEKLCDADCDAAFEAFSAAVDKL